MNKVVSRGIRNNNPGNIRKGESWKGLKFKQTDSQFCQFINMGWGLRALIITLRTYVLKHKLTNVNDIIHRWAPESDGNNTSSYVTYCASYMGFCIVDETDKTTDALQEGLNYKFTANDFYRSKGETPLVLYSLVKAICMMECAYYLTYAEYCEVLDFINGYVKTIKGTQR